MGRGFMGCYRAWAVVDNVAFGLQLVRYWKNAPDARKVGLEGEKLHLASWRAIGRGPRVWRQNSAATNRFGADASPIAIRAQTAAAETSGREMAAGAVDYPRYSEAVFMAIKLVLAFTRPARRASGQR